MFYILTIASLICSLPIYGEELKSEKKVILSEKQLEKIKTTELILENGLHIYLRPNSNSENEVVIQMAAKGGYATFLNNDLSSARLAADIVWESGFSSLTSDQLSALLYDSSIELDYSTKSFYRKIVGESTKDSVPALLKLLTEFFTKPQFNKAGLDEVLTLSLEKLETRDLDSTLKFENAFFQLNTQYDPSKLLLSKEDLSTVDLKKAKRAFKMLYGNPKDFHCIIVGDFSIDAIKPLLIATLGSIPAKKTASLSVPSASSFPKESCVKVVPLKTGPESLTRLTFPIQIQVDETTFWKLEIACQIIEAELKSSLQKHLKNPQTLRVSYEFPFYPNLISPWMFIQYRSDFEKSEELSKKISEVIKQLQAKGPSQDGLKAILDSQKSSDAFWQNEDEYWLSFLTNASLMQWDPEKLFKNKEAQITPEILKKAMCEMFDCSCFTRITSKPE